MTSDEANGVINDRERCTTKRTDVRTGRNGETRQNLKGTAICKLDKRGSLQVSPRRAVPPHSRIRPRRSLRQNWLRTRRPSVSAGELRDFPAKRHAYIRECATVLHTLPQTRRRYRADAATLLRNRDFRATIGYKSR